jgi:hypothetical protein
LWALRYVAAWHSRIISLAPLRALELSAAECVGWVDWAGLAVLLDLRGLAGAD